MLTCHELFGFMPPNLATEIIEAIFASDKPLYHSTIAAVAETRHVRPVFYLKKPRPERHRDVLAALATPRLEQAASLLLNRWLTANQTAMLTDFLDALKIPHKEGIVEEFPETVDEAALNSAVELLLSKYPEKTVAVYLHNLAGAQGLNWPRLIAMLEEDPRLQPG